METGRQHRPVKTLRDVRKPSGTHPAPHHHERAKKPAPGFSFAFFFRPKSKSYSWKPRNRETEKRSLFLRSSVLLFFCSYLIFIGFFANAALSTAELLKAEFPGLKTSAQTLNTGDAIARLDRIHNAVEGVTNGAARSGLALLSAAIGTIIPGFNGIPAALADTATLNEKSLVIAKDMDFLKTDGIELFTGRHGDQLIATLDRLAGNVDAVSQATGNLAAQSARIGSFSGSLASLAQIFSEKLTPLDSTLSQAGDFLNSLVSLLRQPTDQHILLIFQNPTEIRPAGGFIGSFGDLTLSQGGMKELKIDDIYNADRQLTTKLVPPRELSGITPTWGARDANWFFDFPTSAEKVASLLEDSDLYKPQGVRFQGAIAINTDILQSVLEVTGPVTLDKYHMTITPENFLPELQREVETGQDKKPGQNPKRILSALAPLLMEKLHSLSADQKSLLVSKFNDHLAQKDIMIYFRDPQMQHFLETLGIAGDVLQLPGGFSGDYLAVVDANIASGKTDAVITQKVTLDSAISSDGAIADEVSVTRTYGAAPAQDWWYHVANREYLKVLTPEQSQLLAIDGNDPARQLDRPTDTGLQYDPQLASIENTVHPVSGLNAFAGEEFGKTSFGAWMTTNPGTSKAVTLHYRSGGNLDIRDGMAYTFVFEKQSGVDSALAYSVAAPPGYIWKESGKNIYEYDAPHLNARETLTLTLVKSF